MNTSLEVLFAPAEFSALSARDLSATVCVVFDVLRATSSIVTALGNGAHAVIPVAEIAAALELKAAQPEVLLAGERNGRRIRASLAGGIDFDLGNSPREFTRDKVRDRTIVMSTTNGTRALRACARARQVIVGSFLNLGAVAAMLHRLRPTLVVLVGSGTLEQASFEDTLAAGALTDLLWPVYGTGEVADSARIARQLFLREGADLPSALAMGRNGQRLLAQPDLAPDLALCATRDRFYFVPTQQPDGALRCVQ